jgi:hypothetical protein
VRRTPSSEDRRQVRLSLTPKARTLVKRSPPAAQERMMESVLGMRPSERRQLMKLLDQLMAGMAKSDADRQPMLFLDEHREPKKSRAKKK